MLSAAASPSAASRRTLCARIKPPAHTHSRRMALPDELDLNLSSYTDTQLRELHHVTRLQIEHWNKLFLDSDKLRRHREGDRIAFEMLFDQCKKDMVEIEGELRMRSAPAATAAPKKVKCVRGSGSKSPIARHDGSISDKTSSAGGPESPLNDSTPRRSPSNTVSPDHSGDSGTVVGSQVDTSDTHG
jgi:hypothetical protein